MTLIVSLRIPDGIVIAGDSLATMMGNLHVEADLDLTCPSCAHQFKEKKVLPDIPMPQSTLSYAQKVFPFLKDFGVGAFGAGQLMGKTIYFAMRELEKELETKPVTQRPGNATQAAQKIGERAAKLLREQAATENVDVNTMSDDWRPLGFHVVGYDGDKAQILEMSIGKDVRLTTHTQAVVASGQNNVVGAIFGLYKTNLRENPSYQSFSLQDAITYAEFLISTTALHQRFSNTIAGVGGEIDIALVTPFDHFKWVRQKSLQSKLTGDAT